MDAIDRAIRNNKHLCGFEDINNCRWGDLEKARLGKQCFMWGVGACAALLWERCSFGYGEIQVVDSDEKKQGIIADKYLFNDKLEKIGSSVQSTSTIDELNSSDTVIIVAVINGYGEIVRRLKEKGFRHIFAIVAMEANYRKEIANVGDNYIKKCISNALENAIEEKKVYIRSFGTYSDHAKYITNSLLKIRDDLDIVWSVSDLRTETPKGVRKIYINNLDSNIYEMETARIWINNTMFPSYMVKRPRQIYIHTKHWASITLKKFYLASETITDNKADVDNWKYNGEIMDYIFTGSEFDEASCRSGFGFKGSFVRVGSPRTDAMFREEEYKKKIYAKYGIDQDNMLVLYAPTYRYMQNVDGHIAESREIGIDFDKLVYALEKKYSSKWKILLRLHPSVSKYSKKIVKSDSVIDVSDYEDGQELASASDVMISDYSSIMFEPAFVGKPVFLFATDIKDYIDKEYNLLIDYRSMPFPIAENNEELIQNIEKFNYQEYKSNLDNFLDSFDVKEDGKASERAAEFISTVINKEVN